MARRRIRDLRRRLSDEDAAALAEVIVTGFVFAELVLLCFGIGLLVSLFTDFGRDVDDQFAAVLAQVFPVVLLAALVDVRRMVARFVEAEGASPRSQALFTISIYAQVWLFALGEGVLLYALAFDTRTTFIVVTACVAFAIFLVLIAIAPAAAESFGFDRFMTELNELERKRRMKRNQGRNE
jgi:hypothetical protein